MNAFKLTTRLCDFARILCLVISIIAATGAFAVLIDSRESGEEEMLVVSPLNQEFFNLQRNPTLIQLMKYSDDGHPLGLLPSPHDFSHLINKADHALPHPPNLFDILNEEANVNQESIEGVPPTYDLRAHHKLTAIRNQGNCGSCWAFAAYGSLESFLMPAEAWDFSEQNMIDEHGYDWAPCGGGNIIIASAYLSSWAGPLAETDDPYIYTSALKSKAKKLVQEVIYLGARSSAISNNPIKRSVMANGAVYMYIPVESGQ
ncbi:MAG: C1 family peptidase [Candidatus Aminicenantales bacterium]